MSICGSLRAADTVSCLYGVNIQNLADTRGAKRVELIERCGRLRVKAQAACYRWLGTALTVVTDGRFRSLGCPFISPAGPELLSRRCGRINDALVTFS